MSGGSTFLSNSSKEKWTEYQSMPSSEPKAKQSRPQTSTYNSVVGNTEFNLKKNLNESKQFIVEKK